MRISPTFIALSVAITAHVIAAPSVAGEIDKKAVPTVTIKSDPSADKPVLKPWEEDVAARSVRKHWKFLNPVIKRNHASMTVGHSDRKIRGTVIKGISKTLSLSRQVTAQDMVTVGLSHVNGTVDQGTNFGQFKLNSELTSIGIGYNRDLNYDLPDELGLGWSVGASVGRSSDNYSGMVPGTTRTSVTHPGLATDTGATWGVAVRVEKATRFDETNTIVAGLTFMQGIREKSLRQTGAASAGVSSFNPELSYYRKLSSDLLGQVFAGGVLNSHDDLYYSGLSLAYTFDRGDSDIRLTGRYAREIGSSIRGDRFTLGLSAPFALPFFD